MAGIQNNTTAAGIVLPKEISSQIWSDAIASSVAMQKASRMDLPAAGVTVPLITGDPSASWMGETDEISVGESTFGNKFIQGQKVGVIELFSNEFKRDLPALYAALAERLPKTIGTAFDARVFHGTNLPTGFDGLEGAQVLTLNGGAAGAGDTYDDVLAIDTAIYDADGVTDSWLFAPRARKTLLGARDADQRPLLLDSIQNGRNVQSLLGADVEYAKAVYKADAAGDDGEVVGFAGQWSGNAFWGAVQEISVAISTEATINKGGQQINLFQRDMFALRVTAHLGFAVRDLDKFVKITSGVNTVA